MQQKVPEELMVLKPHAVPHPGTVMIHPHHAHPTDAAVVAAGRPHSLALEAVAPVNQRLTRLVKARVHTLLHRPPLLFRHPVYPTFHRVILVPPGITQPLVCDFFFLAFVSG